ncbi:DUF3810 domain-containing protein [Lutibacter sp. Hel_I_33_5]|uniref:DUF3810 domain-containing protein n=1 Tax=Lutibacter sp. Hel_I_33_5 TaxID=1566289 RepID=UPI0011AA8BF0|nr:DUF3810 domain-containing protein [Lutibacter sp. Hel_I_33_5]
MKWNKKHLFLTALLPINSLLVNWISQYPQVIEEYYSNGIYPYISSFFRIIFGWIPFSVGDVLGFVLIYCVIKFIYKLIKSRFKNIIAQLLKITSFLSILYCCFYLFWGLNYFREPLSKKLGYEKTKYTTEQLENTTKLIINKLNKYHLEITKNDSLKVENPYTAKEMYEKALLGYENLENDFPQLKFNFKSTKSSLVSLLQMYNGTSGYLNPITGEAQVNDRIPKTSFPTTACHEMAHQIGYAAENEANFIGFLAANYHTDVYFKYASYRMAFGYCISEMRKRDKSTYKGLWKLVNKGIKKDYNASYDLWQQYQNPIEPLIKKGYNSYLKANNQTKGIESYNYVVDLLILYFRKDLAIVSS